MTRKSIQIIILGFALVINSSPSSADKPEKTTISHGLSFHGEPAYPTDFTHFKYTNPNAPKGGVLKKAALFCALGICRSSPVVSALLADGVPAGIKASGNPAPIRNGFEYLVARSFHEIARKTVT